MTASLTPHFTNEDAPLPLFPLEGVLLLPGAVLSLTVFEPRYRQMVEDALQGHKRIGVIQPRDDGAPPRLYDVGGVGLIKECKGGEKSDLIVSLEGMCRFTITGERHVDTPYRQADVICWDRDERPNPMPLETDTRRTLIDRLGIFLKARDLSTDWEAIEKADDDALVNTLAITCPLTNAEKQFLLEARDTSERAGRLSTLLGFTGNRLGEPLQPVAQ